MEQHLDIMARVFERLLKHGIYLHPQKCVWGVSQLNYLGLLISEKKVSVSAEKIAALREYEVPKNIADACTPVFGVRAIFSNVYTAFRSSHGSGAMPVGGER